MMGKGRKEEKEREEKGKEKKRKERDGTFLLPSRSIDPGQRTALIGIVTMECE